MKLTDYEWSQGTAACQGSIDAVNWRNVQAYASKLHEEEPCNAEALIGIGGRHFVRILTFKRGERWLARFPIHSNDTNDSVMLREADCLRIIAERSTVPVPRVFAAVPREPEYGAAFILMECLPGNVGMDINHSLVPEQHKTAFFRQMANAQVKTPNQHVLPYSVLTHLFPGANIQYPISAHRNTYQTRRWDHKHWTNPCYWRSVRYCVSLLPCMGGSCYIPVIRTKGERGLWLLWRRDLGIYQDVSCEAGRIGRSDCWPL
jgi:hypothetical protein